MATPELWLLRHGATAWAQEGRHTSHTDLPLLPEGEAEARALAPVLARQPFAAVLCSLAAALLMRVVDRRGGDIG
mgnify:CR=1 FL=1